MKSIMWERSLMEKVVSLSYATDDYLIVIDVLDNLKVKF